MKLLLFILAFYILPASAQDTCRTVKSGRWSAGATWFAKKVPAPGSYIIVNHQLTADANAFEVTRKGIQIIDNFFKP